MNSPIAIVGMACRYPDASSPAELWENVLAQRRAFRRIPSERLSADDYFSKDRAAADKTYAMEAAVIEGYEFDRVKFKVVGSTYRSADLAHWLALDVAAAALADAGLGEGTGSLPREGVGVVVGNTLTGEFSRAALMRYRWPYVRRTVEAALEEEGWSVEKTQTFLATLEERYKMPFAPVGEESLAGGLSNTIAGRICNHFDFKGGGYTVDGACASSLLAITNACTALSQGDIDMALAGGVDLSLDPFEIVGFAKAGALASDDMRVYDARSAGFWPGEGCGFVVLMRHDEALAQGRRIYALIRGWGVSSDGMGGITRPEEEGQLLALHRAYQRAGFSPDSIAYFEGHGTGTTVGDATELRTLSRARGPRTSSAAIGSIKANIGHTKAAAGAAGFIKTTMAVYTQVLPPTTGCGRPHAELGGDSAALRVLQEPELWPTSSPLRAGISAMGFGGINTHVVLEGVAAERRRAFTDRERRLMRSSQDVELFLFSAAGITELKKQIARIQSFAAQLSRAELADVAAELSRSLVRGSVRAAVVASSPAELASRLELLSSWLEQGVISRIDVNSGIFVSSGDSVPAIGFAFPGQGSPSHLDGGLHRRRFGEIQELYAANRLSATSDSVATAVAQPAIVTASLAGLRLMRRFGIDGCVGVGHSLGELTALYWADAMDEATLLRVASARGKAMAELGNPTGAMAGIQAAQGQVEALLNGELVVVAGLNSPRQTVISGPSREVEVVVKRAKEAGIRAMKLPVSHAFHSAHVAAAAPVLARHLSGETLRPLQRAVSSTVTGRLLSNNEDLRALLARQVTSPVRFIEAVSNAIQLVSSSTPSARGVDLWIEVGPGSVLKGLLGDMLETPVVSIDAGGQSLHGLLCALGVAFALGAPVRHGLLFEDRFTRPFNVDWKPKFFANPCESAPRCIWSAVAERSGDTALDRSSASSEKAVSPLRSATALHNGASEPRSHSALDVVRQLVAERTELPLSAIHDDSRMLSDLHLNSISVGQLVADSARRMGLAPLAGVTEFANAAVAEIANALEEIARSGGDGLNTPKQRLPAGVDSWVRAFAVDWMEVPLPQHVVHQTRTESGSWQILASPGHPLVAKLQARIDELDGSGVLVCLPTGSPEWLKATHESDIVQLLLRAAAAAAPLKKEGRFVIVQEGWTASAFAKTLRIEFPDLTTCVVALPFNHADAVTWIVKEVREASRYTEARYDSNGIRREQRIRHLPLAADAKPIPLGREDVLLVSGGGKGIAAECALELACKTGTRLIILGRSRPSDDAELAQNLARLTAANVQFRYFAADVTDSVAVHEAIQQAEREVGTITAVLHGAGTNVPKLIPTLTANDFERTLSPKIDGFRNILSSIQPGKLRLLITFGSIIARAGLKGEADYALSNEWLAEFTSDFQRRHPACRCITLEWSVWSGVGMGQRLGRIESLLQHGVTPISPEQGVEMLLQISRRSLPDTRVVVAGRFGDPPTLKIEKPELPFLRFLEKPKVFYPGVELVVDVELSCGSDPYVEDHIYRGERLFPAVMGLEAMAQVAAALQESSAIPNFSQVELKRPIVVAKEGSTTVRIAALCHEPGKVEVVLRCEATAFQVDHFRAVCEFGADRMAEIPGERNGESNHAGHVPLNPAQDIYPQLLFHSGRFQRLRGYRLLRARECVAVIERRPDEKWFGSYLPGTLLLGDAGARDATIHLIQACIPHSQLLPIGIGKITFFAPQLGSDATQLVVHAAENKREGDLFTYSVDVRDDNGQLVERWHDLQLKVVAPIERKMPWPEPLLGCYLERRLEELIPKWSGALALSHNGNGHARGSSEEVLEIALQRRIELFHRADGKPEVIGTNVSAAHCANVTLAAAARNSVACDVEGVTPREISQWQDLLGPQRYALAQQIANELGEQIDTSATRVWTALECLKKSGKPADAPLVLRSSEKDGWLLFASGACVIASYVGARRGSPSMEGIAVLTNGGLS